MVCEAPFALNTCAICMAFITLVCASLSHVDCIIAISAEKGNQTEGLQITAGFWRLCIRKSDEGKDCSPISGISI